MWSWLVRKRNHSTLSKHSSQQVASSIHSNFFCQLSIICWSAVCWLLFPDACMICHKELASETSFSKETEQCESSQKSTVTQQGRKYCQILAYVRKSMPQSRIELLLIWRGGLTSSITSRRSTQQRFFSREKLWKNLSNLRLRMLSFSSSVPVMVCLMDWQKDYHYALHQENLYLFWLAGVVSMRRLCFMRCPLSVNYNVY